MAQQQMNANQLNATIRQLILANGIERVQSIYSATLDPAKGNVIDITPRMVGLVKGFYVDVEIDFTNATGAALALTDFGAANALQQCVFTDLQNNTRVQTSGWHLHAINTARMRNPFGSAIAPTSYPVKYGNNWDVISAPAAPAASASGTVKMRYFVPLAYSDHDLRGAVYAGVTNATMNLQLQLATAAQFAVASANNTLAVYGGNTATLTAYRVNVYQLYLDQLPVGQNGQVLLPPLDLNTIYELKNTALTSMTTGQDFPVSYANFRRFLSTTVIYDNGGTLGVGADINYWSLVTANYTQIFKVSPEEQALFTRNRIGVDYPKGTYYFDHRNKPIDTIQYGNVELNLNPKSANSGARLLVGFEDFATINTVTGAGSLPAGG